MCFFSVLFLCFLGHQLIFISAINNKCFNTLANLFLISLSIIVPSFRVD